MYDDFDTWINIKWTTYVFYLLKQNKYCMYKLVNKIFLFVSVVYRKDEKITFNSFWNLLIVFQSSLYVLI